MKKHPLATIVLIYILLSLVMLFSWQKKEINTVTGDEPHYLIMANGIVKYGSFEQTKPYQEEFRTHEIYKSGLAPKDAQPSPDNTHAVLGPHGLFSVHNIGLPLLLALPFMLGGVIGAKLLMVLGGALVVVAAWRFSSYFSLNKTHKFWAVTALAVSFPLLPAANQIYPDTLAGLLALTGLYWFLTAHHKRPRSLELLLAIAIAFLPWLQIKFTATFAVLVLAISARIYMDSKDLQRVLRILIIAGISCAVLAFYNYYAFGKFSGPYQSGALEINKTSLMVLLGLHIDQNQGFLITSPVNLIGLLALGWIYRCNRTFLLVWGLVFLSLIVPNALHPNWYGGGGFSGRFGWAAAIVFFVPTLYGLLEIGKHQERIFRVIIAGSLLLQLYFFYRYAIVGVNIYNRLGQVFFDDYSIFYSAIHSWMPMLYNVSWAYRYAPNYAWLVVACALLLIGFWGKEKLYTKMPALVTLLLALVFVSAFFKHEQFTGIAFVPAQLPSQTGKILGSERFAEQNLDKPGFVNYGPYYPLHKGKYQVTLTYSSSSGTSNIIGWFDVSNAASGTPVKQMPLHGTNNADQQLSIQFEVPQLQANKFEFRTHWDGSSNIDIKNIVLRQYDD